jgi:subtilisin family serine protease
MFVGAAFPLFALAGCGGGTDSGGVAVSSTPTPVASAATPAPSMVPVTQSNSVDYNTGEYRRSNAAAQAQALTAYNAGATGSGIVVGIIDSGVDATSAEFAGRISPLSADFAGSRGIQDEGGHGTAVADILLGAKNDAGVHGVAFNATLLALRTDTPGTCASAPTGSVDGGCTHNDNAIAAALNAAVAARATVVNISLGGSPANSQLRSAIDRATAAGVIIVISAGNDGVKNPTAAANPDTLAQIANDPVAHGLVIIAGAVNSANALADFSNKAGNSASNYLTALGVSVQSIDQTGKGFYFSGTSFSAPTIAGAVALLAQAFPTLTPAQIVALLYRSADDRGATGVDSTYGNGELNIARAFSPIGSLSLAGSAIPVSLTGNATLGTAMGDAGQGGLSAVIKDEFGRDFGVNLASTVARTAIQQTLANGLAPSARSMAAAGSRTSFALAIDDRNSAQPLLLTSREAERARVLAGSMAIAVTKDLTFGIAGGRGADGLIPNPRMAGEPAFLVADRSLDRAPAGAFAIRQARGGLGLTLAAESGQMRLWQQSELGASADGVRRYAYSELSAAVDGGKGPIGVTAKLTRLDERATVLGSRFGAALGGSGAVSWFADVGATLNPATDWRVNAKLRRGWTQLDANSVRGRSMLRTQSLSADIARNNLWVAGDNLSVRYSEPMRVAGGGLNLIYTGVDAQTLSLTPSGHERDWEAVYARPLGRGWVTANAYWRQQPGNYASAPNDLGAAVRYSFNF